MWGWGAVTKIENLEREGCYLVVSKIQEKLFLKVHVVRLFCY